MHVILLRVMIVCISLHRWLNHGTEAYMYRYVIGKIALPIFNNGMWVTLGTLFIVIYVDTSLLLINMHVTSYLFYDDN